MRIIFWWPEKVRESFKFADSLINLQTKPVRIFLWKATRYKVRPGTVQGAIDDSDDHAGADTSFVETGVS